MNIVDIATSNPMLVAGFSILFVSCIGNFISSTYKEFEAVEVSWVDVALNTLLATSTALAVVLLSAVAFYHHLGI